MSYLLAVIPETIVFQSVGTNLTLTPISFANSFITSISNPLYLFVAGSFIDIGSQSPVVPTLNSLLFKTFCNIESAFALFKNTAKNNMKIILNMT